MLLMQSLTLDMFCMDVRLDVCIDVVRVGASMHIRMRVNMGIRGGNEGASMERRRDRES